MTTDFDALITKAHNLLNKVKSTPTTSLSSGFRNNDFDNLEMDLLMDGIPEAVEDSVVDDESLIKLLEEIQPRNRDTPVEAESFNNSNSLREAFSYCPSSSQSRSARNIQPSYNKTQTAWESNKSFSHVIFINGISNLLFPSFSNEFDQKLSCHIRIFFRDQRPR
jgi:hypothetical protein